MKRLLLFSLILCLLVSCQNGPELKQEKAEVHFETLGGKWQGRLLGDDKDFTLNIYIEDSGPRLMIAYGGISAKPVNQDFSEDGRTLSFSINSEANRAVVTLENDLNGSLQGFFRQQGKETELMFEKISDVPDEEETVKTDLNLTAAERVAILKEYSEYEEGGPGTTYTVVKGDKSRYQDLIDEYQLDKLTEGKEDVALMNALLDWVCEHFPHDGTLSGGSGDIHVLIDFCKRNNGVNCRGLAIILAEMLRAYNIDARHITCMPQEEPFNDCHVVTHAYSEALGKWIILDPSNKVILADENGMLIGLPELRRSYIDGTAVVAGNENPGRDGYPLDLENYLGYMAKNTFRFSCQKDFFYACDGDQNKKEYHLIPKGYENRRKGISITDPDAFWILP